MNIGIVLKLYFYKHNDCFPRLLAKFCCIKTNSMAIRLVDNMTYIGSLSSYLYSNF